MFLLGHLYVNKNELNVICQNMLYDCTSKVEIFDQGLYISLFSPFVYCPSSACTCLKQITINKHCYQISCNICIR